MAKHHIVINPYDKSSVDAAIKQIEQIQKDFQAKVDRLLKELAEIGREAAEDAFNGAVTVTTSKISNGYVISAAGKSVAFLEFGAGATVNPANIYASKMPFTVAKGSWSREPSLHHNNQPGEYYRTGYDHWTFAGFKMSEVIPKNGMQKAYEAINTAVYKKAKEIFK